jgi:nucleotide-binding universal stress UspA family protein
MFKNMLIATDGSEHSKNAARVGIDMAKLTGSKVTALYVIDRGRILVPGGDMSFNIADEVIEGIRKALVSEGDAATSNVEELARQVGLEFEKKIIEGKPADEILKASDGMDVVVIGSIGMTGLDRFLLGSVAEKVVRNSKVPVLVVH